MKKNKFAKLLGLSAISGILLAVPYIFPHCGLVALVAFLPLFAAEYIARKENTRHFWICYYSAFLIWNAVSTWWIWYATPAGGILAIILNAFQMAIIFRIFRFIARKASGLFPYMAFAFMWCAWEHLYHDWQVTWPWLYMGNSFAQSIKHIQWYEITGSIGGSLWILAANSLLFKATANLSESKRSRGYSLSAMLVIAIPSILSHIRYSNLENETGEKKGVSKEVVILQPNIDPYTDKFLGMAQREQDNRLLSLAETAVTDSTYIAVAPETFFNPSVIAGDIVENYPKNETLDNIRSFASGKRINFIFGAVTHLYYTESVTQPTRSARLNKNVWWDVFNSAVFIGKDTSISFYHKSKLVMMAETVPYINGKSVLSSFGLDLGGGFGNYGIQERRTVFDCQDGIKIGTAICYESVFGNFFREYILAGANLMTIITNDGWWENTSGHIQHLNYARLRAIETRRDIARSANTGISAIINKRGDIISRTPWWKECAIKGKITPNNEITPFVKYGDIAGYISCWLAAASIAVALFMGRKRKNRS